MAKLYGAQMAQRVTDWAVQVHGGYGFSGEFDVERYFRDARILGLYEGTNEIQKLIIAERILGPSSKKGEVRRWRPRPRIVSSARSCVGGVPRASSARTRPRSRSWTS